MSRGDRHRLVAQSILKGVSHLSPLDRTHSSLTVSSSKRDQATSRPPEAVEAEYFQSPQLASGRCVG
jgi:hypothetical protein